MRVLFIRDADLNRPSYGLRDSRLASWVISDNVGVVNELLDPVFRWFINDMTTVNVFLNLSNNKLKQLRRAVNSDGSAAEHSRLVT